jgi:hypothetical protein
MTVGFFQLEHVADAEPDEEMLQLIMSNHEQFNFEKLFEAYGGSNSTLL